jgi:hypothetical protein
MVAPAAACADDLDRWRPWYRFDRAEIDFPVGADGSSDAVVYGRDVRDGGQRWLQYWNYYRYNRQDRGISALGRHEGDWEVVQVRLDRGRPVEGVYAQHSWAERCPVRGVPDVWVANGSHASYFKRGVHDRPWPDPSDESRGGTNDGYDFRPRVVRITRDSPSWMRKSTRWGKSRAGWFPGEQSSPLGPAFQHDRFDHPAAWAATARACGSGAPPRPAALYLVLVPLAAVALVAVSRVTRRRASR